MADIISKMTNAEIETLAKTLGEGMTGSELTAFLNECRIQEVSGESTKWKRIKAVFVAQQERDGNSIAFIRFIQKTLEPVRFISEGNLNYEKLLNDVNKALMFVGLEVTQEGKIRVIQKATSVSEVERRTKNLVKELDKRDIHKDVLACCKEEFLQENYFHAVFEAAKSLSEKVRNLTGISEDGSKLFDSAFSCSNPCLAVNSLKTSTEKNQQNGLREMLNGITHMIRNVTAHELKIKWAIKEKEAVDVLTTISFLHKQIDECIFVPQSLQNNMQ